MSKTPTVMRLQRTSQVYVRETNERKYKMKYEGSTKESSTRKSQGAVLLGNPTSFSFGIVKQTYPIYRFDTAS